MSKKFIEMRVLLAIIESSLILKGTAIEFVVAVNYDFRMVYIRFIGTHKAYDKIDVKTI